MVVSAFLGGVKRRPSTLIWPFCGRIELDGAAHVPCGREFGRQPDTEHRSQKTEQRTDEGQRTENPQVLAQQPLQFHAIQRENALHLLAGKIRGIERDFQRVGDEIRIFAADPDGIFDLTLADALFNPFRGAGVEASDAHKGDNAFQRVRDHHH